MPHLNHCLSESSALSGACILHALSNLNPELLKRRVQADWQLSGTATFTPEGKDLFRKRAVSLHAMQPHTYMLQRNPLLKKYILVDPHFPRTLSSHWYRISTPQKTNILSAQLSWFSLLSDGTLLEGECNGKPYLLKDH